MDINQLYRIYQQHPSVTTDSRKIQLGDIFFALKGPNFNGNEYAQKAFDDGASLCIIDEDLGFSDERLIHVDNCLDTLQQLAKFHREQFKIPFVAITGSNGKTTSKELIHTVLSAKYKTYSTEGNLNNHIGIPLTLLKIKTDAEIAIIEMGANHQKEIEGYCKYALPTHGLITNCGKAHLEGFGGVEGVKKGKGELFDYLKTSGGIVFINADYAYLNEMSRGIPQIITYGTAHADTVGSIIEGNSEFLNVHIHDNVGGFNINSRLVGEYNLPNILAAVSIGRIFQIDKATIKKALEAYTPDNSRSQLMELGSNRIILDAYNANPSSMKAAVENFAKLPGNIKVLLLGGMMELGEESFHEHQSLVELIARYNWQQVVLVGDGFKGLVAGYKHFNNVTETRQWYREQQFTSTHILIKGSRSMQMEKVLE